MWWRALGLWAAAGGMAPVGVDTAEALAMLAASDTSRLRRRTLRRMKEYLFVFIPPEHHHDSVRRAATDRA